MARSSNEENWNHLGMPREAYWIILTNPHLTETFVSLDTTYQIQIAPNNELRRGDTVYLWANPFDGFYAWGEVAETPQVLSIEERRAFDVEKLKRMNIVVTKLKGLQPNITAEMMSSRSGLRGLIPSGYDDLVAIPLRPGQAALLSDYVRERKLDAPKASETIRWFAEEIPPQITIQTVITAGDKVSEGTLIEGITIAWDYIVDLILRNPDEIYEIDPRKFEELIAGAYKRAGYHEVILTPRSADKGRDVIATMHGVGSLRIIDQVKRNRISHPVTADDVRALAGVLSMEQNVSKGVVTTSGIFAPGIEKDELIQRLVPHRLELRDRDVVIPLLKKLRGR